MTIIAGFSASRQGSAPLLLAAQIARCTGSRIIAVAIVERPGAPRDDPIEEEYLSYLGAQAKQSLERVVNQMSDNLDIWVMVQHATSIPVGLTDLATEMNADLVVVGSSTSGLLGRIALGSVTDRLVHTASVPVAIAPRGYPMSTGRINRLTVAYGGRADMVGLIATSAELAKKWSVRLRVASFTVRPVTLFGGAIESSAEELVVKQWARRTHEEIAGQLDEIRASIAVPGVEVVIGAGSNWSDAVDDVAWESGDLLLLGSGAAGPSTQVFLGSAAARILRHAPVPAMIVPRQQDRR